MKPICFLGLAGMIDPPREEVFDAVAQCKTAGIVPVMITGDHPLTAKTIAQRIGILNNEDDIVITGQQLAALNNDQLLAEVENIKVYARVSPEQKLLIAPIVDCFKEGRSTPPSIIRLLFRGGVYNLINRSNNSRFIGIV